MEIDVEAERVVVKEEIETVVFNQRREVSISPIEEEGRVTTDQEEKIEEISRIRKEGAVTIDQERNIEEISPTRNEEMEMINHEETIVETIGAMAIGIADHKDETEMIEEVGLSQTIDIQAQEIEISKGNSTTAMTEVMIDEGLTRMVKTTETEARKGKEEIIRISADRTIVQVKTNTAIANRRNLTNATHGTKKTRFQ